MKIHEQMKAGKDSWEERARFNRLREVLLGDGMDEISGVLL